MVPVSPRYAEPAHWPARSCQAWNTPVTSNAGSRCRRVSPTSYRGGGSGCVPERPRLVRHDVRPDGHRAAGDRRRSRRRCRCRSPSGVRMLPPPARARGCHRREPFGETTPLLAERIRAGEASWRRRAQSSLNHRRCVQSTTVPAPANLPPNSLRRCPGSSSSVAPAGVRRRWSSPRTASVVAWPRQATLAVRRSSTVPARILTLPLKPLPPKP